MAIATDLLSADRAMDRDWRSGVGVAKAATHAKQLSDLLRQNDLIDDAKEIISDRQSCNPDEAFVRLVFVSEHTKRGVRELAREVVASVAAERQVLPVHPPRLYRFTL
jgi:AmiR/NasT family two-component response regulator